MIMLCGHCGNKTSLIDRGGYEHKVPFFNNEQDKFTRRKTAWRGRTNLLRKDGTSRAAFLRLTRDMKKSHAY
jgi:hypothetical protein